MLHSILFPSQYLTYTLKVFLQSDGSCLRTMLEITQSTEYDKAASSLVALYEFVGSSTTLLQEAINIEVQKCSDPTTQFRGNNLSPKILGHYAKKVGEPYLEKVLKPLVEKVTKSNENGEVRNNHLQSSIDLIRSIPTNSDRLTKLIQI